LILLVFAIVINHGAPFLVRSFHFVCACCRFTDSFAGLLLEVLPSFFQSLAVLFKFPDVSIHIIHLGFLGGNLLHGLLPVSLQCLFVVLQVFDLEQVAFFDAEQVVQYRLVVFKIVPVFVVGVIHVQIDVTQILNIVGCRLLLDFFNGNLL
jgi:hypothetical protein